MRRSGWREVATRGRLGAGRHGRETAGAFLDKAGRFPILVQYLKPIHFGPADHGAGYRADGMGWADRGGSGNPEHRIGAMGE
jgi:hypothetical protein